MKHLSDWLEKRLSLLDKDGLIRTPRAMSRTENGCVVMDGKSLVNFGSNDYLNYATDARVQDAVSQVIQSEYWGTGASPLVTGRTPVHAELEQRLADFTNTDAALIFPSGFAANVGVIAALMESGDTIFSDEKNHASIIDGCRLSRATTNIYPHCDMESLETQLSHTSRTGKRLIVTDTLFSMDGDMAPLDHICKIAAKHDAIVMVDEAHATGVFGTHGMGVSEYLNCDRGVAVHVGTFSKALGSLGGFVSGSRSLIEWLTNQARSYVFSTSPPAATCAAVIATLGLVQDEPERRVALLRRAEQFRQSLIAE